KAIQPLGLSSTKTSISRMPARANAQPTTGRLPLTVVLVEDLGRSQTARMELVAVLSVDGAAVVGRLSLFRLNSARARRSSSIVRDASASFWSRLVRAD